jgi:hypothetical protein
MHLHVAKDMVVSVLYTSTLSTKSTLLSALRWMPIERASLAAEGCCDPQEQIAMCMR